MLLLASVENGWEDRVSEDEVSGIPRKSESVGTDEDTTSPEGEGLPEGSPIQSTIDGGKLALSQQPRTSSYLLAIE